VHKLSDMRYVTILLCTVLVSAGNNIKAQETTGRHLGRPNPKHMGKLAPSKYKLEQFTGRWQEVSRTSSKTKEAVPVEDTFYIRFYDGGKADTKQGSSVVITGLSEVQSGDYITTSASDFKIVSLADNEMALDDENGYIHTFNRTDQFAYEKVVTAPEAVADTTAPIVDLTPASLVKNWYAYRRGANPGVINNQTPIIRELKITGGSNNTYKGEIQFSQKGTAISKACTINIAEDKTATIVTDVTTWNIIFYKCDGQEMILGKKGDIVYYFKNNN